MLLPVSSKLRATLTFVLATTSMAEWACGRLFYDLISRVLSFLKLLCSSLQKLANKHNYTIKYLFCFFFRHSNFKYVKKSKFSFSFVVYLFYYVVSSGILTIVHFTVNFFYYSRLFVLVIHFAEYFYFSHFCL